ncbi:hypothetical protein ISF_04185 [Cordyceps fumosorosea ARSEF 2679]|uniref:Uncharacterized protein n=1 Tax=Cordyceps fumosorosea (strain ARSEF 2679) TaxID=1081104 RepID=A0A167XBQ5_CORFA|nr:hypothetical protein ISF_04185 [Cordyceps fumosorosea ARSEF 2679]OAA64775.1 hypothetical protein ISF_04185 [Cordyceps fumosorosea ARSEF 2679]
MAESADGPDGLDELYLHRDFLGGSTDLVSSSWSQASGYFPNFSGGGNLPFGLYNPFPATEASADLELADPEAGYRNDVDVRGSASSWEEGFWNTPSGSQVGNELEEFFGQPQTNQVASLQQTLDTRFTTQITPSQARQTPQRVFKQENSPTRPSAQHDYSYTTHHSITMPQYGPPTPLGSFTSAAVGQVPGQLVAPPSPTSPFRRKRRSSSSNSSASIPSPTSTHTIDDNNSTVSGRGGGISKPKKRMIKQQPNRSKAPMTAQQETLRQLIDAEGTGIFHQHIPSAEIGAANHAELMRMYAKEPAVCTDPSTDDTFPVCTEQEQMYIRDMYNAVWDWSDYGEMSKTLGVASMAAWREAMALPEGDLHRAQLLQQVPSRKEQQKKVLSRVLSDYIVEEICWRLLESYATFRDRVAAICDSLRASKQLVKSLLSAGNGWCKRIANNPKGEFTHKVNNMKVNRRKNERLREATSMQKKEEE